MFKSLFLCNTAFCIALLLSLSSCSGGKLHKTYTGPDKPADKVAIFNWDGTWYMGLALYKADGKPFTGRPDDGTWPCMYNGRNTGGFNVAVLPGRRVFELYNAKTVKVSVCRVSFNMEAGKTYTLVGDEEKFIITCDGKDIKADIGPIPVYDQPAPGAPHGVLKIKGGLFGDTVALFRIDDKVSNPMYKCHPKWVAINEDNIIAGMVDFETRLSPGKHSIEYTVLMKTVGPRITSFAVKTLTFNVRAGKNYIYKVIPAPEDGKSDVYEKTIDIIEE